MLQNLTSRRFRPGALSAGPKGDPGLLLIFQDFLLLSNHITVNVYLKGQCDYDQNRVWNWCPGLR